MIHTVSTFLTLTLAIWRFIMIQFPARSVTLCTVARCRALLCLGYGGWHPAPHTSLSYHPITLPLTPSRPVLPLFLTIPNGLSSLATVYIYEKEKEKINYRSLYNFEVSSAVV
jgi:hypothetical protein